MVVEVKGPRTYVVKEQGSDRRIHVHADDMVSSQVRLEATAHQTPEFVDTCTEPAAPSEEGRKTLPPAADALLDSEVSVMTNTDPRETGNTALSDNPNQGAERRYPVRTRKPVVCLDL